jgi:hypothetical protein
MPVTPTPRSQPYRRGTGRDPNSALMAMLLGKPFFSQNPMDPWRQLQHQNALLQALRRS